MDLPKNNLLPLILFLWQLSVISSQTPGDDCSLRIRKHFRKISYQRTNPHCTSGKIWWNYPSGRVVVDFQNEEGHKPFLLCLILKPDQAEIKFYDITEGENKSRELPLSRKGYYTCVPDLNGRVSVLMSGPFFPITYLYMLQYRLLVDWEPRKKLSSAL